MFLIEQIRSSLLILAPLMQGTLTWAPDLQPNPPP